MTSRPKLHFLSRGQRYMEPSLSPQTTLLPRRVFEGDAELLAIHDRFVSFREAAVEQSNLAGQARIAADAAEQAYADARREALGTGGDLDAIENEAPALREDVVKHQENAKAAQQGILGVARELAHAFTEAAPDLLAPSEQRLETAAAVIENAVDSLEAAALDYELAWRERRILGKSAIYGGPVGNFDSGRNLPSEIAGAIQTLRAHLGGLDKLRSDEAILTAERPDGEQN